MSDLISFVAPPAATGLSQSSASSMWEWPLRHHWPLEVPLAMRASVWPSGEGAALNSFR